MKKLLLLLTLTFVLFTFSRAQEYADFEFTGANEGSGTFNSAILSDFLWVATGTINGSVQILDDEVFDNGNEFENTFGQADYVENLRLQVYPNGGGTAGGPILSNATLTINFDQVTPDEGWGVCVVDIDVENCLISAIDEYDNEVPVEDINEWLMELFDANLAEDGTNIPKWDPSHAALLGSDTPEDYVVYNNLVIGSMDDSEAAAAFFMPDIPLKSLTIDYENLQEDYFTSYHFYIASLLQTVIAEKTTKTIAVYPNPASTFVNIKLAYQSVKQHTTKNLNLYNVLGGIVLQTELADDKLTLDVSYLPSGVYCVKAIVDGQPVTKKLIIK